MGEWESGRVGEWESGRVGEWESGSVGEWESGSVSELREHHVLFLFSRSGMAPAFTRAAIVIEVDRRRMRLT